MKFEILDCTFRDGGYYTKWDFNDVLLNSYIDAINDLPISYCEIGYRSLNQISYHGEYFYSNLNTLKKIRALLSSSIKIAIMIDVKNINVNDIDKLLDNCEKYVDLIRISTTKNNLEKTFKVAEIIKKNGYKVAINIMYFHEFIQNDNLLKKLKKFSSIEYLYFVDSYGSCFPEQVYEFISKAKIILKNKIGFHGHNNLEMAFANSIYAIKAGANIIDSTILGFGRGSGNLKTEIITYYLNKLEKKDFNILSLSRCLEIWNSFISTFKNSNNYPYVISGFDQLPQSEIMSLLSMERYGTSKILSIVKNINGSLQDKQNIFPSLSKLIEKLNLKTESIVVIGGGETAASHNQAIREFGLKNNSLIIHSSTKNYHHYHDYDSYQLICLSGDEFLKINKKTSELIKKNKKVFFVMGSQNSNYHELKKYMKENFEVFLIESEVSNNNIINDSPLCLALITTVCFKSKNILMAGFDGFLSKNRNHFQNENITIFKIFKNKFPNLNLISVTPTNYDLPESSIYSLNLQ